MCFSLGVGTKSAFKPVDKGTDTILVCISTNLSTYPTIIMFLTKLYSGPSVCSFKDGAYSESGHVFTILWVDVLH